MASIDFEAFKERVSLEQIVKALLPTATRINPLWKRGPCALCHHADMRACTYNWQRSLFYCHRCWKGGGQITFASLLLGMNSFQAVKVVCERLGIEIPWRERVRRRRRHRDRSGEVIAGDDDDDVLT